MPSRHLPKVGPSVDLQKLSLPRWRPYYIRSTMGSLYVSCDAAKCPPVIAPSHIAGTTSEVGRTLQKQRVPGLNTSSDQDATEKLSGDKRVVTNGEGPDDYRMT